MGGGFVLLAIPTGTHPKYTHLILY